MSKSVHRGDTGREEKGILAHFKQVPKKWGEIALWRCLCLSLILEELKGTIGKQQAKAVLGARALSCRRADSHAVKLCWCPNGEDEYELPAGNGTWSVLSTEACQGTVRPVHDMG